MIVTLNSIIIIVLQDVKTEIKVERNQWEEIDIKDELRPTINLIPSVKKEEVRKC